MNLNEARAARREARGESPTVVVDDVTFEMPFEMPIDVALKLAELSEMEEGDNAGAIKIVADVTRVLFGDRYDEFMGLARPSVDDLNDILRGIMEEYGTTQGESPASAS